MQINSLTISGIGGIKELELKFNCGFNVLCGANGIGKTTVLNIIADAFAYTYSLLKRNATYTEGSYTINFEDVSCENRSKSFVVKEFNPLTKDTGRNVSVETQHILYFGIDRMINYQELQAIPKDPKRTTFNAADQFKTGINAGDIKGWFENRFLFYNQNNSLCDEQKKNFEIAKGAFGLLDSSVQFKTVDASSLDIMLSSTSGDIYFEYLSAGYKTCIFIVLGIIKEIEFRFNNPYITISEFDGVILIDEIDLHLHPTWQSKLVATLKSIFSKAQFIVTTHSPSILQSLDAKEIIPLAMDESGNISLKELNLGEYGLQGWTIEEILRDVMGLPCTTSELFQEVKQKFDKAMDDEDVPEIKRYYAVLDKMLHPNSTVKKLIDIQMVGLGE